MPEAGKRRDDVGPSAALRQEQQRPARVLFVQDGSRRAYAVPVALAKAGILDQVFTEWYSASGSLQRRLAQLVRVLRPALGQRMLDRHHPGLPSSVVRSNPCLLIWQELAKLRFDDVDKCDDALMAVAGRYYQWRATTVTRWIVRRGFGNANLLHGFIRNLDPALAQAAREQGLRTLGDQINAPASIRAVEQRRQFERWPDWEPGSIVDAGSGEGMVRWERETRLMLDHITAPSPYVREGLLAEGIHPSKITVLPNPSQPAAYMDRKHADPGGRLTVGFVGNVNLRKGAPYFVEIARRFQRRDVRFVMVGGVQLSDWAVHHARDAVDLVGHVPRSTVKEWLAQFDLFFFPSTCEGSANAVMEAMAAGLPVVTSPNSGSVIRDGQDGYLVPYDDLDQAEARIAALISDRNLRRSLGEAARRRAAAFDLDWYSAELAALIKTLCHRQSVGSDGGAAHVHEMHASRS